MINERRRQGCKARLFVATFATIFASLLPGSVSAQTPPTVVLWTVNVPPTDMHGDWAQIADATAAGGAALWNPNRGRATVSPALAAPSDYFDIAFTAEAGVPYRIWLRMRADGNLKSNDSVHVQFSDAVDAS